MRNFAEAFMALYDCGVLDGALVFVLCINCDDVTVATDGMHASTCARCGLAVPGHAQRGKYAMPN